MAPISREIVCISLPTPFVIGPVNVYLVKSDALVLVDAGPNAPDSYAALVAGLKDHGCAISDLDALFVTHHHIDHIGQIGRLAEESGAPIVAHESIPPHVEDFMAEEAARGERLVALMHEMGTPADLLEAIRIYRRHFREWGTSYEVDDRLKDGESRFGLEARHVPGHSISDTLFIDDRLREAIVGDHLLRRIHPVPLLRLPGPDGVRGRSLVEFRQSLRITRAVDVDCCHPGHAEVITEHRAQVDRLLARQERRCRQIYDVLRDAPGTPHDLCKTLYPKAGPDTYYMALSNTVGHLELLEGHGNAMTEERGGRTWYTAARTYTEMES